MALLVTCGFARSLSGLTARLSACCSPRMPVVGSGSSRQGCVPSLQPALRYVNGTKGSGRQRAAPGKPRNSFPVDEASLSHFGIKRAVEFMHERYAKRLDLEEVAAKACLSKYHFSRLFHRIVDMSFQDYLIQIRGEKATQLLRQTPYLSLTRIAHRVGFGSLRNFEGQFKKLTGQSPSECRAGSEKKSARSFAKRARSRA